MPRQCLEASFTDTPTVEAGSVSIVPDLVQLYGILILGFDKSVDVLLKLLDGVVLGHVVGITLPDSETDLQSAEPGGPTGREVELEVRKPRGPAIVVWVACTMAAEHDMVSYSRRGHSDNPIHGVKTLNAPPTIPVREGHLTRRQLQGGKQGRSPIALIVGTVADQRATVGRLELPLPPLESPGPSRVTEAYDIRIFRWCYVGPDNIRRSGNEFRSGVFIPRAHCLGRHCRCRPPACNPMGRNSVYQCRRNVRSPSLSRPSPQAPRRSSSMSSLHPRAVAGRPARV